MRDGASSGRGARGSGATGSPPTTARVTGRRPTGTFGLGPVVYGLDPDPGVRLRYHRLACGDWWDEDPRSATYNTFRHVACGTNPPFRGGSEALWRITPAYRLFALIEYNVAPVVAGRGSAIFLHVDTGRSTNGCVSLPLLELRRLLVRLRPGATITIRIQTAHNFTISV